MKAIFVIFAFLFVMVAARPADDDDQYDSKYDDFDVDSLLNNERLLKNYILCFLGKGACTTEGKDFKKSLPEAIESKCAKCSPKQLSMARQMTKAVKEKLPEEWEELVKMYDPEGKHKEAFDKFLSDSD